jgi:amino acid adenylation domain-containing protein
MTTPMGDGFRDRRTAIALAKTKLLEQRLRESGSGPARLGRMTAGPRPDMVPMSYGQQRLWLADRLRGGTLVYNVVDARRLNGPLDVEALERALDTIVMRHESLRTRFDVVDGQPIQIVTPAPVRLRISDFRNVDAAARASAIEAALREESRTLFDLTRGPVLRLHLLRLGSEDNVLLRTVHHIVSDGWSQAIFDRELELLYSAYCDGREIELPRLPLQYADFALWERRWLDEDGRLEAGLAYWREQLAGWPGGVALRTSRSDRTTASDEAGQCQVWLSPQRVDALRQTSEAHQATLFMTLLAGLAVILWRHTGQNDIAVRSPVANRHDPRLEEIIGYFVAVLLVRVRVRPADSLSALLAAVRRTAFDGYQHLDVPYDLALTARSQGSLCDVSFSMHNQPATAPAFADLRVEPMWSGDARVRNDIEIHVTEDGGSLTISWLFAAALFDRWRIERMARDYAHVLDLFATDLARTIDSIDLLTDIERRAVLSASTGPVRMPLQTSAVSLIEERAACAADTTAIVFGNAAISYGALNDAANRLARVLIGRSIGPGDRVAILMPRSPEAYVAILAVLKAGAAYLPLDWSHPSAWLSSVLSESAPAAVVTTKDAAPHLPDVADPIVIDDSATALLLDRSEASSPGDHERTRRLQPAHPAYVLYTSGSSGRPKAVVVTHEGLSTLAAAQCDRFAVDARSRVLQFASLSFDASVSELLMAWTSGATLVGVPDDKRAGEALRQVVVTHGVTHATLPPVVLRTLPAAQLPSLQTLIVAGDACPAELAARWAGNCRMINAYGPTETTVCATMSAPLVASDTVPLGTPIWNSSAFVLDEALRLAPPGVAGELFVAGKGVAQGYMNRPALTAERFVANPFGPPGTRMYRTGDRAEWHDDGQLRFLGRVDHQVKLRGLRVEPGEIETLLRQEPFVGDAVVVAACGANDDIRLHAYVTARRSGEPVDTRQLRQTLSTHLPEFMVPASIAVLDTFPLTASGKVDRHQLPAVEAFSTATYEAPRTKLEEILCGLFAELLERDVVGLDDNFFELGGHSLLAVQFVSRVAASLGVDLPLDTLFDAATVRQLAPHVEHAPGASMVLTKATRPNPLPASPGQQRLWFIDRLDGGSVQYNIPDALRLRGPLDHRALERAIEAIVERHEILRTRFAEVDGSPVQAIAPPSVVSLSVDDLRGLGSQAEERVRRAVSQEADWKFDLAQGPLWRIRLLRVANDDHILLRTFHHIISDAWSHLVFTRELAALYSAFREERPSPLPPLEVQYGDFAAWQHQRLAGGALEAGLAYWKNQLTGAPDRIELPADRPRPSVPTFAAHSCFRRLDRARVAALKQLGLASRVSVHMTLLAAFAALLSRYSRQSDVVIGSPFANREDRRLEDLIGFFINVIALRIRVRGDASFEELLAEVRQTSLAGYQHQDVPFERVVEALAPPRRLNMTPVFQVVFEYQNGLEAPDRLAGLEVEPFSLGDMRIRYDLELHAGERDGEIGLWWSYSRELFDLWRIEQMARHFERLLEAVVADPRQPINGISLLSGSERVELRNWGTGPRPDAAPEVPQTMAGRFEAQAARTPDATAVVLRDCRLTYAALNSAANRTARELIAAGIGPEDVIGVALPRSIEMIVTLLGIAKAGAAYLPLDLDNPVDRLARVLDEARPRMLFTTTEASAKFPGRALAAIDDEAFVERLAGRDGHDVTDRERMAALHPAHAAYVMYTSGSTGVPKGIVTTQRGVTGLVSNPNYVHLGPDEVILQLSSVAFDLLTFEMWSPLLHGAVLVLSPTPATDLDGLADELRMREVTTMWLTAGLFKLVVEHRLSALAGVRQLMAGGDAVPPDEARRVLTAFPECELINGYGPTEATVFAACFRLREWDGRSETVPIGRPIQHACVQVLDEWLQPVPVGVQGELYISGRGLARGYAGRAALTAERFVADPFGPAGARMYRSGDLAAWRADGTLEFLGRADIQVKIRGFRVELAEIEAALKAHPSVADAIVHASPASVDARALLASVIVAPGQTFDPVAVLDDLREVLPDYMVPAAIVPLEAWPLTSSGKVDRRALAAQYRNSRATYRAPRTLEERVLCDLFAEVLGVERVGITDNFFEVGGHSFLAVQLSSRVHAVLGLDVTVSALIEAPCVAELAARLGDMHYTSKRFERILRLRAHGTLAPIFCLPPGVGLGWGYSGLLRVLEPRRPVYCLQSQGIAEDVPLPSSVDALADDYTALIRGLQPYGPYHLLGWSFGAVVAHAIACRLQQDADVALLAMLDGYPVGSRYTDAFAGHVHADLSSSIGALMGDVGLSEDETRRVVALANHTPGLMAAFHPGYFRGDLLLFGAAENAKHAQLWQPHVSGRVHVCPMDCHHLEMTTPKALGIIGPELEKWLGGTDHPVNEERHAGSGLVADPAQ